MDSSYNLAMRNPILTASPVYSQYNQQPTTRLTLEQQAYQQPFQQAQQVQTDPYTDYLSVLNSCTNITREKIMQDERYIQIYMQCKNGLDQINYAHLMPEFLNTQQGRMMVEQLHTMTKTLKDEYMQADIQRERDSADLERRLTERERRLEEKERQIDEMLSKANLVQTQQSTSDQENSPSPAPQQNQHTEIKQYQDLNQNNFSDIRGSVNE